NIESVAQAVYRGIGMVIVSLFLSVLWSHAFAQEKASPIPAPPDLNLQMIQSVLTEKDAVLNSKMLELARAHAIEDQLKQTILSKQTEIDELKKSGTKCPE